SMNIAALAEEEIPPTGFYHYTTVEARVHVQHENSSGWQKVTPCPVLVHLYNDGFEDEPRFMAEHNGETMIDCTLPPSFSFQCPTKTVIHLRRHHSQMPVLALRFSHHDEMELLLVESICLRLR
ncbi:hypothetical protein PENTCL1PPCAC_3235, partial [Pristionchus entomophagus]